MGKKCCVRNCENSVGKPKELLHNFPKVSNLRQSWLDSLQDQIRNGGSVNIDYFGVCTRHFVKHDYVEVGVLGSNSHKRKTLRPTAIPSLNLPFNQNGKKL